MSKRKQGCVWIWEFEIQGFEEKLVDINLTTHDDVIVNFGDFA